MRYVSTRGGCAPLRFADAVMTGLAPDGGLLMPERFVDISTELDDWRRLSFAEVAQRLFRLYADDMPGETLDAVVADACATFSHPDVAPLVDLGAFKVLELFHGPTLSFKDIALQMLGRLFARILERGGGGALNILAATSGDTGSAAIHGVRGLPRLGIFVLYPNGRISPLQELQMTAVADANVHCLAIDGSFDDCQSLAKSLFGDLPFKSRHCLGAVNSMNWARILAQMSYYLYASLRVGGAAVFSVPTGNFGNIFAGLAARAMGAPIDRLVLATNENDILARFFATGIYRRGRVRHTLSPAMDIQVASNFERFLYLRFGRDAQRVEAFMADFAQHGEARADAAAQCDGIAAVAVDDAATARAMGDIYRGAGYIADPHTAVGIAAARRVAAEAAPICLAAAHPAKFPQAVREATGAAVRHDRLDALDASAARRTVLAADRAAVQGYIAAHA